MTKARTNASVAPAVGRNMIINGAMNVSQRATSVTGLGAANGYFTCDRWFFEEGDASAGRLTMSQTADGPNGISANCLKLDCTTADTSIAAGEYLLIQQILEGQNVQRIGKGVIGAKQITVSFYVKANASFTFGCEVFDVDNGRQCTKLFSTTTDWVRHELTFPADVDDGSSPFVDDNGIGADLLFWLHAGTTYTGGTLNTASFANQTAANRAPGIDSFFSNTANNFFLTGVQMEVGPVATEFEQEEISFTLAKCQRYFEKTYDQGTAVATATATGSIQFRGGNGDTAAGYTQTPLRYAVAKRATPTVAFYDTAGTSGHWTSAGGVSGARNIAALRSFSTGFTTNMGETFDQVNGHFTADAEL